LKLCALTGNAILCNECRYMKEAKYAHRIVGSVDSLVKFYDDRDAVYAKLVGLYIAAHTGKHA